MSVCFSLANKQYKRSAFQMMVQLVRKWVLISELWNTSEQKRKI